LNKSLSLVALLSALLTTSALNCSKQLNLLIQEDKAILPLVEETIAIDELTEMIGADCFEIPDFVYKRMKINDLMLDKAKILKATAAQCDVQDCEKIIAKIEEDQTELAQYLRALKNTPPNNIQAKIVTMDQLEKLRQAFELCSLTIDMSHKELAALDYVPQEDIHLLNCFFSLIDEIGKMAQKQLATMPFLQRCACITQLDKNTKKHNCNSK
jgi:hypothetical protein